MGQRVSASSGCKPCNQRPRQMQHHESWTPAIKLDQKNKYVVRVSVSIPYRQKGINIRLRHLPPFDTSIPPSQYLLSSDRDSLQRAMIYFSLTTNYVSQRNKINNTTHSNNHNVCSACKQRPDHAKPNSRPACRPKIPPVKITACKKTIRCTQGPTQEQSSKLFSREKTHNTLAQSGYDKNMCIGPPPKV